MMRTMTLSTAELYARCNDTFATHVAMIGDRWSAPSELPGWSVRDLVHHVVLEERWTPPLMAGATIADVGDALDGDLLGPEPAAAHAAAAAAALAAVMGDGALERTVHLSFGDVPGAEYARQLAADHLVHAWDLARALGADEQLDPDAASAVLDWFAGAEDAYRAAGAIGPRVAIAADAGIQAQLLARFGRQP